MSYGNIWHDCMSPYTCNPISLLMTNRFRHHKPANQQPTCWSFNWPADHRSLDQHYISIIRSMHAWKRTMYVLEEIDLPLQRESNCLGLKLRSNLGWCPSSTTQEVQIPENQYCWSAGAFLEKENTGDRFVIWDHSDHAIAVGLGSLHAVQSTCSQFSCCTNGGLLRSFASRRCHFSWSNIFCLCTLFLQLCL